MSDGLKVDLGRVDERMLNITKRLERIEEISKLQSSSTSTQPPTSTQPMQEEGEEGGEGDGLEMMVNELSLIFHHLSPQVNIRWLIRW